jgi:hypothetical protein
MVVRTGRLARRRNKDELVLRHLLLGRGQRLRENGFGGGDIGGLLLRVRCFFEGVVMGLDSILVLVSRTRRCPLRRRSEANIDVKTKQLIRSESTGCMSSARKTYDASIPNFGRIFFSVRGGRRLFRGIVGITLSSSLPKERWASSRSSESSTTSAIGFLFEALGGDGAAEVDPSGTSVNSRPGYSPISGCGG